MYLQVSACLLGAAAPSPGRACWGESNAMQERRLLKRRHRQRTRVAATPPARGRDSPRPSCGRSFTPPTGAGSGVLSIPDLYISKLARGIRWMGMTRGSPESSRRGSSGEPLWS